MNFLKIVASFLVLLSVSLSSSLHIRGVFKKRETSLSLLSLFNVIIVIIVIIIMIAARRSDGYNDVGGVYNSAIAQDYWASR